MNNLTEHCKKHNKLKVPHHKSYGGPSPNTVAPLRLEAFNETA